MNPKLLSLVEANIEGTESKVQFEVLALQIKPSDLVILKSSTEIGEDQAFVYVQALGDILRGKGITSPLIFLNPNWSVETVPLEMIEKIYQEAKNAESSEGLS